MHLVLVPGHLCDRRMWTHQIDHLSNLAEVQVANTTTGSSMEDIAARLLADAPTRFALAGLSMGGMICMEVMRQAPERVERLALLDTNAMADTPERAVIRRRMADQGVQGDIPSLVDEFLDLLVPPERRTDAVLVGAIRTMMEEVAGTALTQQIAALLDRPDSRPDMPDYDLPVLLICGRQDRLTPLEWHEEMAGLIPDARLAVIEECAHMSTMERPQAVTALLRDWLLYP